MSKQLRFLDTPMRGVKLIHMLGIGHSRMARLVQVLPHL